MEMKMNIVRKLLTNVLDLKLQARPLQLSRSLHHTSACIFFSFQVLFQPWNFVEKNGRQSLLVRCQCMITTIASDREFGQRVTVQLWANWSGLWNVNSGNAMITRYARSGRIQDARNVFDKMYERNVISWTAIIWGYIQNGRINEARYLFEKMPERNIVSWNTMIAGYICNGRIECARQVFDKMPERNVVSWNLMISAYARKGEIEAACQLFNEMPEQNVISWTAMVAGYAQNGRIDDARHLFNRMPERNVVTWNAMVAGYAQNGRIDDARELFNKMSDRNVISWNAMIAGYAQNMRMLDARLLFDKMPKRNTASWNSMVAGYVQNETIDEARQMFDRMPERDVVSWTAMITGYVQCEQGEDALKIFHQMQQAAAKPNQATFTSILSACASLAALNQGKQVQGHTIKMGFQLDAFVGSSLISMYSKCGCINDARLMFDKIPEKDVVAWNAIITGYAQHGCENEALQIFEEMQLAGMKPNDVTFVGVLSTCSHTGLVDESLRFFDCMNKDYCIIQRADHYACLIDLLGRAGRLEEAANIAKNATCEPNSCMWGALLGACKIHGHMELGKLAAEHLINAGSENAGAYILLSNIYAVDDRWDDAARVRERMKSRGLKKQPGCSWIEVKNRMHIFLVGDRTHAQSEKIYSMLEHLEWQMKQAGYVPNTNLVLHDVEEKLKEHILP